MFENSNIYKLDYLNSIALCKFSLYFRIGKNLQFAFGQLRHRQNKKEIQM
jgi:hypothetical protein